MTTRTATAAACAAAVLLLAGCAGSVRVSPSSSAPTTGDTPTIPVSSSTTPAVSLGSWTPTCDSASDDAVALVDNLTSQPGLGVDKPSAVAGFAAAAAAAVAPLKSCPVAHSLAVRGEIQVGADPAATKVVQDRLTALLRTVTLSLSEAKVGRAKFGTPLADVQPTLVAVLGKPKTATSSCELSGEKWTILSWGSLHIGFDANKPDAPLDYWSLRPAESHPTNLASGGKWPLSATLAKLQTINPKLKQSSLFGEGPPWLVDAASSMHYLWDDKSSGPATNVVGGGLHTCE